MAFELVRTPVFRPEEGCRLRNRHAWVQFRRDSLAVEAYSSKIRKGLISVHGKCRWQWRLGFKLVIFAEEDEIQNDEGHHE